MIRFRVIGSIASIETVAVGNSIRTLSYLQRRFGHGRWRKLKGVATVEFFGGSIRRVELHWYEAHGIGRVFLKVKRYVD